MNRHREQLARALGVLQAAAKNELNNNSYYMVASKITELQEVADIYDLTGAPSNTAPSTLPAAIESVRRSGDEALTDNRYYAFAHKLDALSFIARPLSGAGEASDRSKPVVDAKAASSQTAPSAHGSAHAYDESLTRSFDNLAILSKTRLQAVANALNKRDNGTALSGSTPVSEYGACEQAQLHRRRVDNGEHARSEQSLVEMEAARIAAESDQSRKSEETRATPGSSAASCRVGERSSDAARPAGEAATASAFSSATAEDDTAPASASQKIGGATVRDHAAHSTGAGMTSLFAKLLGLWR